MMLQAPRPRLREHASTTADAFSRVRLPMAPHQECTAATEALRDEASNASMT
jgi:hypothetical protein